MTYDYRIDWNGDGDFDDTGENVTSRILDVRDSVTVSYGRDQARSLSPVGPGQASFTLNNTSRDYSPENSSSPLAGSILPSRPVRIQKTHAAQTYTLFRGFTDSFDVLPERTERSVKIECLDLIARFRETIISTEVYFGIRTGQAIGYILDEMGWPAADRDIDPGATLIRWWWEEGADAFDALDRVVNSEGIPALATVDSDGKFVFRDRHHRLTRTASTTSQVTFRGTGTEPLFSAPLSYDQGWRDIVNTVSLSVEHRAPSPVLENVFETDSTYSMSDGETIEISVQASDPFTSAEVPEEDTDFTLRSGNVIVSLSRTEGASTTIFVKATGGPAVVDGMRLRARPIQVVSTFQVHAEDPTSIQRYGRRSYNQDARWAGVHDAAAIAAVALAHRAERLPIVRLRLVSGSNGNSTRLTQMLTRDLSDRVTIVESETGLNEDFFIERIEHTITEVGRVHETIFGCEKAPVQPTDPFTFDVSGQGFDDGVFAETGLSDPANIFLMDGSSGHRFDEGVFAW